MDILTVRPAIDEHDFNTIRQMYGEAQQWARRYEGMVVNANVLVISASLIFLGLAFDKDIPVNQSVIILIVPLAMSVIGIFLTKMLFKNKNRSAQFDRVIGELRSGYHIC